VDLDAVVEAVVAGSAYPGVRAWAESYVRAEVGDLEALAAFGPREGRGAGDAPGVASRERGGPT
jgi:hypothetical protein